MPSFTCTNKSFIAFHIETPNKIETIIEKKKDLLEEKLKIVNALIKVIVSPEKKENQLEIVLGFPNGKGDVLFVDQFLNLDFIMSANINPDMKHIKAPHDNQKIGSSIESICLYSDMYSLILISSKL